MTPTEAKDIDQLLETFVKSLEGMEQTLGCLAESLDEGSEARQRVHEMDDSITHAFQDMARLRWFWLENMVTEAEDPRKEAAAKVQRALDEHLPAVCEAAGLENAKIEVEIKLL